MCLLRFAKAPSIFHLGLRKKMSLIFFDDVQQMFFNFDYSRSKISFQEEFDSFDFHSFDVKIESLITEVVRLRTSVDFSTMVNLSCLIIDLLRNYLNQTMLVWQKIRRHLFLTQKLFHLNCIDVKLAILSLLLSNSLKKNVVDVNVLFV